MTELPTFLNWDHVHRKKKHFSLFHFFHKLRTSIKRELDTKILRDAKNNQMVASSSCV